MTENLTSIKELVGTRVYKGSRLAHKIGKIQHAVFFPDRKCIAGFTTKQADLLLMIKRKDHFITTQGFFLDDGKAYVRPEKTSSDKAAFAALGLDLDELVHWVGMPIITENGLNLGSVSDVYFDSLSGQVHSIEASFGAMEKLFQGVKSIPTAMIQGYRRGDNVAQALALAKSETVLGSRGMRAAIVVANEVAEIDIDGEKSYMSQAGKKATEIAQSAGVDTAAVSEKAKSAVVVAGSVASAGATAAGKQLEKTRGMFSAFREAYQKARHDEE